MLQGGGYKTGGGGASEVLPLQKGVRGRKSFSQPEEGERGGGGTSFGGGLIQVLKV